MRMSRTFLILAALAAMALGLWETPTAQADSLSEEVTQPVLEALPPVDEVSGHQSATLSARLHDSDGRALSGVPVTFFILNTVFGERLMRVGEVLTDATGTASLVYKPTWLGDHTVVVRFNGNDNYVPVQTSFHFSAAGPVPVHEDAPFGLEPVREWAPVGAGLVVLAVWGVLGLVMMRTMLGIPAGASTAEPAAVPVPMPPVAEPSRPAPLVRPLLLVAALVLVALPVAWLLTRGDGEGEIRISTELGRFLDGQGQEQEVVKQPAEKALPATLVRSVPAMTTDARGQLTPDSADLPADVALMKDRVFVLDTNNGRILVVTGDGKLAPIFESEWTGDTSLLGATAMTVHDGKLYLASPRSGNVVVLSPSGRLEGVISPQVPEGQEPLRPAGVAVTAQGQVWLSDPDNHRILLVNAQGEFLGAIGQGTQSSGEYGFDTPGGLALDQQGNLWVVDTGNHLAKKYSPMGVFLAAIGEDRLAEPKAVAVDDAGNVFVSDGRLASILVFGPDGTYLGSIGRERPGDSGSPSWLQAPYGLKVEGKFLYVMDRLAGLLVFQLEGSHES